MLESGQHRPYLWEQPFLHFTHAGKQASWPCFQENQSLDIYVQSTDFNVNQFFFFQKKKREQNLHSDVLESALAFSLCTFFVFGLQLGVQW